MTISNEMSINSIGNSQEEISRSSSEEWRYVMMFKSLFDQEQFPNDFDVWTVEEQSVWLTKNIATFFPNVPKSLLSFIPAAYRQGDCGRSPVEIPEWLDMDKYRRGQKFARENYTSLLIAVILGIMHLYSFEEALKSLIISKRSHTPYLGFKRYASTIRRFLSWYNGEPWIEGTRAYADMQYARRMHLMIRAKLCELDNDQIETESKIAKPWCPDRELFLKDFAAACPLQKTGQNPYLIFTKSPYMPKGMNNADMAGLQCCVVSLVLICPQDIGVHNATDEDVEAFCHMWRCYGYYLGMEEEYNFFRGNLEEIKQRTRDYYQHCIMPNFKDISPYWEHMTRCIVEPFNYYPSLYVSYKMVALFAMDTLKINMPHLYASMSYAEWITYKIWRFIFRYGLKYSTIRVIVNKVLQNIVNKAMNFGPEKEAELKEKSEKQLSKFSVMHS